MNTKLGIIETSISKIIESSREWNINKDKELVKYINYLSEKHGKTPFQLKFKNVEAPTSTDFPLLESTSLYSLRVRFSLYKVNLYLMYKLI